jgi:hypothetical protein
VLVRGACKMDGCDHLPGLLWRLSNGDTVFVALYASRLPVAA